MEYMLLLRSTMILKKLQENDSEGGEKFGQKNDSGESFLTFMGSVYRQFHILSFQITSR
jgi:hypothetical protein